MSLVRLLDDLAASRIELRLEDGKLRYKAPEGALTAKLRERIADCRDELVAYIGGRQEPDALWCAPSPAQEGLWFFDHVQGPNGIYNIPFALSLHGSLDRQALRLALDDLVCRHQALRASFHHDGESLKMKIERELRSPWVEEEVAAGGEGVRSPSVMQRIAGIAGHCFDLACAPLISVVLFRFSPEEHLLVLNVHHIVVDGWSVSLMIRDLAAFYEARCARRDPLLPPMAWQLSDSLSWLEGRSGGAAAASDLEYWRETLSGAPACTTMPTDFLRPALQGYAGASEPFVIDSGTTSRLRARARRSGATLNHVALAATALLLSDFSGSRDLVVGMPVANRVRRELEPVVGMFVNVVPIRLRLSPDMTLDGLVDAVKQASASAMSHAALPFEHLVKAIGGDKELSMSPVFQVAYDYLPPMDGRLAFGGLEAMVEEFGVKAGISKYDCTFYFDDKEGGLSGNVEFNTALYRPESVQRWVRAFRAIFSSMLETPDAPLESLPLIGASERDSVASWCTGPVVPLPDASPWARFEQVALGIPDSIALDDGGLRLSYRELLRRAEVVSSLLAGRSIGKGDRVGLLLPRGADQVAAMLGVVRLGGVFVPFDTSHPQDRLKAMADRAMLGAVLCLSGNDAAAGLAPAVIGIDGGAWSGFSPLPLPEAVDAGHGDPLYLIFTSGSTGMPKAVSIPWQGLCNVVQAYAGTCRIATGDRISAMASTAFDASLLEVWPALLSGGTLVFVPDEARLDPEALRDWLIAERVAVHFSPTPMAEALLVLAWPGSVPLRLMTTGGQALHFHPSASLPFGVVNMYGPTECSIVATWCRLDAAGAGAGLPTIGRAIDNTRVAVLDQTLRRTSPGTIGELFVSGAGMALGYFGDPVSTAEKFVLLPDEAGTIWYRTGDHVRLLAGGELEFIGRVDGQVKLRGHRIETGEIESALLRVSGIRHAAVRLEGERLAAYVEADAGMVPEDVRREVSSFLPDYMVPACVIVLDSLPRQTSGKIDLAGLPFFRSHAEQAGAPAAAPGAGTLVTGIARAWSAVLEHPSPGPDDNFFDLGGHSMMLVRLRERIRQETGRDIGVLDLLRYPTISRQAEFLGRGARLQPAGFAPDRPASEGAIAIIGMAGRFPQADSVDEFWRNLCGERDCISRFSRDELIAAGVPPELAESPDYVPANGILSGHDHFDADFFGISAREAEVMDPQQRLLLEEAWHTFEDAGLDPAAIGGRVGVFVGSSMNTYLFENVLPHRDIVESLGTFAVMIGNDKDFAATRISYKLGLRGPSLSVNTACSTSLVAIHQAVTAIHAGQCELALAGGACVRSRQVDGYLYEMGGVLSRDGACRAFDADATGMVGGNGIALVLLKPLDRAMADGDPIHAVIRSVAVNNDGCDKVGFTAPGISGQSLVIGDALKRAGVAPETVLYVEAHGTGTRLGDSIEVAALAENYAATDREHPLFIGSVKTGIGHLDAAAGAAGLIKTALSLRHKTLVPSLHFKEANPQIPWPGDRIRVSAGTRLMDGSSAPLRASVSSFGIGGTNAHAILEEPPRPNPEPATEDDGSPRLLLFSGKSEKALQANASAISSWLGRQDGLHTLRDVSHTLAFGRHHWECRGALAAATAAEAADLLSEPLPTVDPAGSVAFLFSGMGAHHPGMGSSLYRRSPVFRRHIDECSALLEPMIGLDIRTLLLAAPDDLLAADRLNHHGIGQPAVFALEFSLAMFWMDLGLKPSILIGHSLGEWVAACVAGVFALSDALSLVSLRGRLMEEQPKGAMLAVNSTESDLAGRLPEGLDIATVNSTDQAVIAGPEADIERFEAELRAEQIQCKRLQVHLAAHSSLMEPAIEPLRAAIEAVERRQQDPSMQVVSNITGACVAGGSLQSPDYWTMHLRQCVRFADGLATLWDRPGLALLECGPGNTLCNIAQRDDRRPDNRALVSSLCGGAGSDVEWRCLLGAAGTLWSAGLPIGLEKLFSLQGDSGRRIPVPGYAFQRRRYWLGEAALPEVPLGAQAPSGPEDGATGNAVSNLSPVEGQVIAFIRELLGPVVMGRHRDFFLSGGNSLLAVRLASRLRDFFGIPVTPLQIMAERTPARIAAFIEDAGASSACSGEGDGCLVLLSKGDGSLPPIVLVHAVGGGIFIYRELLQALDTAHPVYGLQAPGLWDDADPLDGVRAQARHYHAALLRAGVERPLMLAGSSYGGLVCYELDRLYREAGHSPSILALFDSPGPGHMPARMESEAEICAWMLSRDIPGRDYESDLELLRGLDHEGRVALLVEEFRKGFMPCATEREVNSLLRVFARNLANMWEWIPDPHATHILFFKAGEHVRLLAERPELAWVPLAPDGIDILTVAGDHSSMLSFPHVHGIATEINDRLAAACPNGKSPSADAEMVVVFDDACDDAHG